MLELLPYQKETVERILHERQYLIAYDMGLGKTVTAIEALRRAEVRSALIVHPAIARSTWTRELALWWKNSPVINILRTTTSKPSPNMINIVSYGCAKALLEDQTIWDAIILDEIHYIKNSRSKRTKALLDVRKRVHKKSLVLGLTGTPIDDKPSDLWQQLDFLRPRRYGSWYTFCLHFSQRIPNKYAHSGWTFQGLNEENVSELRKKLSHIAHRVSTSEVAHLIPPLVIRRLYTDRKARPEKAVTEKAFVAQTERYQSAKVRHAKDWIKDQHEAGHKHLVLMTFLRSTARLISEICDDTTLITGALSADKREAAISAARASDRSIVACTMSSVGLSINSLAAYNNILFVELSYHCGTVLQAIRRFGRLNSADRSIVDLLILSGGIEELVASTLQDKFADIENVFGIGGTESQLNQALGLDEKNWTKKLLDIASNYVED
jgi:SNF2 family DNA or RNA helicase